MNHSTAEILQELSVLVVQIGQGVREKLHELRLRNQSPTLTHRLLQRYHLLPSDLAQLLDQVGSVEQVWQLGRWLESVHRVAEQHEIKNAPASRAGAERLAHRTAIFQVAYRIEQAVTCLDVLHHRYVHTGLSNLAETGHAFPMCTSLTEMQQLVAAAWNLNQHLAEHWAYHCDCGFTLIPTKPRAART